MQSRVRSLDVLRALAACSVVLFHSNERFFVGAAGVDLFFVISGFVIAAVMNERPSPNFLLDRAARIYPLYWVALMPWAISAANRGTLTPSQLFMDLALFPRWVVPHEPLLSLSWTLVFELLFYCGAAIAMRFGSAKPVLAAFLLAAAIWAATGWSLFAWIGNPMVLEFLFGALIYRMRKVPRAGLQVLIVGIAMLAFTPAISREALDFTSALIRAVVWGGPAAMIVYGLVSIDHRLRSPVVDRLCWLGVASYSIYLFHPLAIALILKPWWAKFVFGVVVGAVAWLLLESRFEKLRRSLRRNRPVTAAEPSDGPPLSSSSAALVVEQGS